MDFKKIILYSLIGFILSGVFFGSIIYFTVFRPQQETSNNVKTYEHSIGEFTTNLSNMRTYFKGEIIVETTNKKLLEVFTKKNAEIRDKVFSILNTKTPEDVLDPNGQQKLRKEIIQSISEIVGSDSITNIYFTDYIIQ